MLEPVELWRTLRAPTGAGILLAVDFPSGRAEAGFPELAKGLATGHGLLESVPARFAAPTAADYVDAWLAEIGRRRLDVRAIAAYCVGGVLADVLAGALESTGAARPRLVLFDPETVKAHTLYWQFRWAAGRLVEGLTADRIDGSCEGVRRTLDEHGGALEHAAEVISAEYRALVRAAYAKLELDFGADIADEQCERFDVYFQYLVAAGTAAYSDAGRDSLVVASRDYEAPHWFADRLSRFDIPRKELLADPDVARLVSDALA